MNKYIIRAVHVDGARVPEREIEAESPADALEVFEAWLITTHGFDSRRLQCINIDKLQRIGYD